jgi:hypothetical protein
MEMEGKKRWRGRNGGVGIEERSSKVGGGAS